MANTCNICNKELSVLTGRVKFCDGYICTNCLRINKIDTSMNVLMEYQKISVNTIHARISKSKENAENYMKFRPEKAIELSTIRSLTKYEEIQFDSERKQFAILRNKKIELYQYNELIEFELLKDGYSITKGGLGRAAVGALAFGDIGAIVGSVTGGKKARGVVESMRIKLTLNNIVNPTTYLEFVSLPLKESSSPYKTASNKVQECLSILQLVCSENESVNENEKNGVGVRETSGADEILKFKKLFDKGIITKEEFEAKKKVLLDL